jgi:membrane-bound acyltransferase YfiQ involved in biofilm formation
MASMNQVLGIAIWIAAIVVLASGTDSVLDSVLSVLFCAPFCLGPHAVTHGLCFMLRSQKAAVLLAVGMLAYAGWFLYVYLDAFYWNVDAQSAIALVFVGLLSLPVMIPVWLAAFALEQSAKVKGVVGRGVGPTAEG